MSTPPRDTYTEYYAQLNGKTVTGVVRDAGDESNEPLYALRFDDGSIAWIVCDPEGNGPGFLDIQRGR